MARLMDQGTPAGGLDFKVRATGLAAASLFFCHFNSGFTPVHYFWYYDTISLVEDNLVFELNGALVRRPGELLYSSHSADSIEAETKPPTQDFIPRSVNDFLIDLAFGNENASAGPMVAAGRNWARATLFQDLTPSSPRHSLPLLFQ